MFNKRRIIDQIPGVPLRSLLSETSKIPERHGELSGVIEGLPIVTCRKLGRISSRAMRNYFKEADTPKPVREQVRQVALGMSAATQATFKYLKDESLPDVDINEYFPDLNLKLCDKEEKLIDQSIRSVIGRTGLGGYFDHGKDNRTYLFRIATGDPHLNMVAELHRHRMHEDYFDLTDGHVDVRYSMTIAGYDNIS
jgi:hypothetical protein